MKSCSLCFLFQMVAQVCVMETEDALWIRMDGTVSAKWAGVAQDVMLSWKWCVAITWITMEVLNIAHVHIFICEFL